MLSDDYINDTEELSDLANTCIIIGCLQMGIDIIIVLYMSCMTCVLR